ncbi:MAG: cohesin domain-containing protein [Microbacterium sp.]|uniref:cohesin domain-containing protein n=1 Tax=Microbacterium sp. TaxID=51671 RepID=UPI0039E64565
MPENTHAPRPRRRLAALLAAVAAAGLALVAAPAAHAASDPYTAITVTSDASVTVGDTVTVAVDATGLLDAYAYTVTLGYDPALLSFDTTSPVYPAGGYGAATTGTGTVTFSATRLGTSPGLTGDQNLVTFTFTALSAGTATITLTDGSIVASDDTTSAITTGTAELTAETTIAAAPVTDDGTGTDDGTTTGSETTTTSGSTASDGSLAVTGQDAAPWVATGAFALTLIALGTVLALRRRGATR